MFFKRERNTVQILQYLIVATMEYWISYLSIPHERERTLPLPGTRGYATRPGNESITIESCGDYDSPFVLCDYGINHQPCDLNRILLKLCRTLGKKK